MRQTLLRTQETHERYASAPKNARLFALPDRKILTWGIVSNEYPYDAVTERHDLLFPLRKVAGYEDLTEQEIADLHAILSSLSQYDSVLYNTSKAQTVPSWFHLHLLKWIATAQ
jgi:hypothetical protein